MNEANREKLEAEITKALEDLAVSPNDEMTLNRLETLCRLSNDDYVATERAYKDDLLANAEKEKMEQEIEIKREQLESDKQNRKFETGLKIAGVTVSAAIPIIAIYAERAGEFIHRIGIQLAPKIKN